MHDSLAQTLASLRFQVFVCWGDLLHQDGSSRAASGCATHP
ncbi:MAG: hypothetical protein H6953_10820 [Chromatiaceae bacterium]|nr:hypothetical protein [Chromatiaceae bacterium]